MLQQRTIEKNLSWEKVSNDEFQVSFPKSSISVKRFNKYEEPSEFALCIINQKGEMIFQVNDENIDDFASKEDHNCLEILFKMISDQYFQVDDTIKDILINLDICDLI